MRVLVLTLLCAPALVAQQTWLVNCQGLPGTDFLDIPPAVAAASAGDTILVYRTCLSSGGAYTAATIDKPLRIVGIDGFAPSSGGTGPGRAECRGRFTITGISAGNQVLLSNLVVQFSNLPASGLEVTNCAGDVVLEDCLFAGGSWPGFIFRIDMCANVTMRGCVLELNGSPVEVTDSNLLITTTLIEHQGNGGASSNPPGLLLHDSTVTIIGSIVYGMGNTNGPTNPNANYGAILHDSTLRVGPASLLSGGGIGGPWFNHEFGYNAPMLDSSVVEVDARAVIQDTGPFIRPPMTPTEIDATFHSWITANQPYGVTVAGPNNGFALLVLGNLTAPTPTSMGMLSIDPGTMQVVDLVGLPASNGSHAWTLPCPSGAPSGVGFAFQALTLSPSGQFGLTVPSPLTVAWQLGVVPQ
ncbi:MAG TPA: hypothetical protein VFZ65_15015 [Planctomycetota bacterium]|nr:hypothetical protein [Planctomycetota bacterium]